MVDVHMADDEDFRGINEEGERRYPRADETTILLYFGTESGRITEDTEKFMNDLCKKSKASVWYDWADLELCPPDLVPRMFHYILLPELVKKLKELASKSMLLANRGARKSDLIDAVLSAIKFSTDILTESDVYNKISDVIDAFPDADFIFDCLRPGQPSNASLDMNLSAAQSSEPLPPRTGARFAVRGMYEADYYGRIVISGVGLVLQKREDWAAYLDIKAKEIPMIPIIVPNESFTFTATCKDEGNVCLRTELEFPGLPDREDFANRVMEKLRQASILCTEIAIKVPMLPTSTSQAQQPFLVWEAGMILDLATVQKNAEGDAVEVEVEVLKKAEPVNVVASEEPDVADDFSDQQKAVAHRL